MTKPFEFKNVGTETLKILEAKPRCICSVAENYTREVPPGQSGVIPFKLNTTAKHGRVDESLTIKTNDPNTPDMVLRLAGLVKTVCRVEVLHDDAVRDNSPEFVNMRASSAIFGRVEANQKLGRILRMVNTTGAPLSLELSTITPEDSHFRAHLKETKPGQEYELSVHGDPPFAIGHNSATIVFTTNISDFPLYQLAVSAYVAPRVEIIPQKIVIDPDYPFIATRFVRINNNGDTPLEITGFSATEPSFNLSMMPNSASAPKVRAVQVIIPLDYHPPPYGEIVRINTTDKEHAQIDIPVLPDMNKEATPRPADKPMKFYPGTMPAPPTGR